MKKQDKEIQLNVVEALEDDAYKGIARIDKKLMDDLGVSRGDFIFIKGNKETIAIVDKSYPADEGEGIIRIDGILRRNAKSSIGENVKISKANVEEAKKITIAPSQKGIMVQGDAEGLKRGLLGRGIVKGDILVIGARKRQDLLSDDLGDLNEVFGNVLGNMGLGNFGGNTGKIKFVVASTNPSKPVKITENTEVILNPKAVDIKEDHVPDITYEDIGGVEKEIKKVREMIEIPLKHPEVFSKLGIDPPKGVLLHGPPGTGKTLLAKAVANESDANFILVNGPEIHNAMYGGSEKKIREIFEEAEKTSPSIVFIDEIDAIAPKREDVHGEVERRVVSQLLTMMDGLKGRGNVIVVGATNRVNSIEPALRRPGRFDREISISVPDKAGRHSILKIHTRGMPLTKDVKLDKISSLTHGFVGADLQALTKEAAMNVLRNMLPSLKLDSAEEIPQEILEKMVIKQKDFFEALKVVRPSALREVLIETPNVSWNDIGGVDEIRNELKEAVEWPLKYSKSFERMGIRAPKGILLYGPPGTGKTLLAKAVAKESEANFISVKGPSLLSKWVNESHKGIRKVFEKARQAAPCVVFFDEIESLASKRGGSDNASSQEGTKVLNQLLSEMEGMEDLKDVLVIGATNRPDMLDPALLRPGRFDKLLLVNAPDEKSRENILKIHTDKMPLGKDVSLKELSKNTVGYTGADLESFVREAAMIALRESINSKEVCKKHFNKALEKIKASVSSNTIEVYKKVEDDYLRAAKPAVPSKNYLG